MNVPQSVDSQTLLVNICNPQDRQVEVYRSARSVEVMQSPNSIDCQDVMPGFNLDLTKIL